MTSLEDMKRTGASFKHMIAILLPSRPIHNSTLDIVRK